MIAASKPSSRRPKGRYIITWAQNATPVHAKFLASLLRYPAELVVVAGRYKNPTSVWSDRDKSDDYWADEVEPYLSFANRQLCPNLMLYSEIRIRPTAVTPLTGFEVFCGKNSGIFGHPRRAFETIATATRTPRILTTTGACTVPNYTDSKEGQKGKAHHRLGALVVEVESDGIYHLRHVSAGNDGTFIDLDKRYTPEGVSDAPPALALTLGDLHAGKEDPPVLAATKRLYRRLRPQRVILHDVLDFASRNHHDKTLHARIQRATASVYEEVKHATAAVRSIERWGKHETVVVRSNHDEMFDRWLSECRPDLDPINAGYYFDMWSRLYGEYLRKGKFPAAFPFEAKRMGSKARYLELNESLKIRGVEYGFHGHKGLNGARGNHRAYAKLGTKTVTAHEHAPGIRDGNYRPGVTAQLDHGYNSLPSGWLQTQVVQYADGHRALITIVNGRYCGGVQ